MNHPDSTFTPLLIVVFLAFAVPVILSRFKRLRIPIVVGEILAGIVIGRSGFNLVSPENPILDFIAEFGLVFLMFLSGMEIDFSSLGFSSQSHNKKIVRRWSPLTLASSSFVLTLASSTIIGFVLVKLGLARNPWMMGLILSTTSLGVVVPVLKEKGIIGSQFGQCILFAALIADFATMFLITILVAILSHGFTFNILLISLLFLAFFLLLRFGRFMNNLTGFRRTLEELSHATGQIKVRSAFAIMLSFVVLSQTLGTEVILGAFLAGVSIAILITPSDSEVTHQLESIGYGFLIPVFFIKVGIDFDLAALFSSPKSLLLVPLLIVAAILVKILPALIFRLRYSWRESFGIGALLSARLSLIIAAAAVGTQIGVISQATNTAILMVAIITVTLAPIAFSLLLPATKPKAIPPVIVAGAGELGLHVAGQLRAHEEGVIVIDEDEAPVESALKRGFEAIQASIDSTDPQIINILSGCQTLVCTYADSEQSYRTCQVARTNYGIPHVIAQVTNPGDVLRFEQIGVSAINAALDLAALITILARNPAVYSLLTRTTDDKEIYEVVVESETCMGKTLRQLNLPGDTLILAVQRDGDLMVPHGNTQIERDDHLTLFSSLEWVPLSQQMFSKFWMTGE